MTGNMTQRKRHRSRKPCIPAAPTVAPKVKESAKELAILSYPLDMNPKNPATLFMDGLPEIAESVLGAAAFLLCLGIFIASWYNTGSLWVALMATCILGPIAFFIVGFAVLVPVGIILSLICMVFARYE